MSASARLAWSIAGSGIVLIAASLLLLAANLSTTSINVLAALAIEVDALASLTFGLVVTLHAKGRHVGWVALALGLAWAVNGFAIEYSIWASLSSTQLPGGAFAAWYVRWSSPALEGFLGTLLLLTFPTGRLLSRRWSPILWIAAASSATLVVARAFGPEVLPRYGPNPFVIDQVGAILKVAGNAARELVYALTVVAAFSLAVRFHRGAPEVRRQVKWLMIAALPVAIAAEVPLAFPDLDRPIGLFIGLVGIPAIAVAAGFAVLKYRLYDIELVINRAVVYTSATIVLVAAFLTLSEAARRLATAIAGASSDIVTPALIAAAALSFAPLQRRIRPLVDRLLPPRAGVTLMFTDIVESTARAVAMGDEKWRQTIDTYYSTVRRALRRFRGGEVDTAGDGFFVMFERPADALRAATQIRNAVSELGLSTRFGLHVGVCEMRGEKVTGLAVIIAARVMAVARPNEILLSSAMRDAMGDSHELEDRGEHALKGLPGLFRLYAASAV